MLISKSRHLMQSTPQAWTYFYKQGSLT